MRSVIKSKGRLAVMLSKLEGLKEPKVSVEQYPTESEICAFVLWQAYYLNDIKCKVIADLGCGNGILGIGALILGAKKVYFIDIDKNVLKIAKRNVNKIKSECWVEGEAEFVCENVVCDKLDIMCDVVVQNPPFGVKVRHQDRNFLVSAFKLAPVVYSFHKSVCKLFVRNFSKRYGFKVSHEWDFLFPIKAMYKFHKRRIKRIKVSCLRLIKELNI